jgi:hypothetical protein
MKNVIVFKESFGNDIHRVYQLDSKQSFYDSLTEEGKGFSVATTNQYPHLFTFFDTVADAEMYIKEKHAGVVVDKSEADVFCPKCNRGYMACDHSDLEVFWSYKKTCACDHTFKIEGRQIILYNVVSD